MRRNSSGSCSRIQAIFAPTWPPSRLQPLVAYSCSGSTRSAIAPQTSSPRRSIQMIASRSGSPCSSTQTRPSSCAPNDSAAIRDRSTPAVASATVRLSAASQARGSCSAQPGRG